jgi:tRNA (uracil-5-)-methyltransferase TRM9
MKPEIARKLQIINHQFYQTFANDFSATRQRLQNGVRKIADLIPKNASVLDLGCGNGNLATYISENGFSGKFTGLDFSAGLIDIAKNSGIEDSHFEVADLTDNDWDEKLTKQSFDMVLSFAVMHHLAGSEFRVEFLKKIYALLKPGGEFIHSHWQFLNSNRLAARVQPWEKIDLQASDVEPGDYLLDWKRGGTAYRYVHQYSSEELVALAKQARFSVIDEFSSDGEGGNLGLYQRWCKE